MLRAMPQWAQEMDQQRQPAAGAGGGRAGGGGREPNRRAARARAWGWEPVRGRRPPAAQARAMARARAGFPGSRFKAEATAAAPALEERMEGTEVMAAAGASTSRWSARQ